LDPSPLVRAAAKGSTNIINHLLDHGADIDNDLTYTHENERLRGSTPVNEAVAGGHVQAAALLVASGADPTFGPYCPKALYSASKSPDPTFEKMLVASPKFANFRLVER
jgi:ankyrin repeat protein